MQIQLSLTRIQNWMVALVITMMVLFACTGPVQATQTDNYGIHAVPAPGKVNVDGRLNDWDLSGQVLMCYDIETLRDVYSAQVAMMYDASHLYISLHWKDPLPMGNRHDPRYQANMGWAGDCVQLRLKTDRIAHITAWYYPPRQEPTIQISYGKSLTEPFDGGEIQLLRTGNAATQPWLLDKGAEMAFLKDADGKGYVQEIKLPWNLITTNKKYGPGEQLICGVELLWGEADWPVHRYADNLQPGTSSREFFWTAHNSWGPVWLERKGQLKLPAPAYLIKATQPEGAPSGPVEIRYKLPKDARVTLAIEDAIGRRIRNLIAALPRRRGANMEKWDGLNDNGQPVPPGQYTYKALYHDGIRVNYVMSFANPGNPPWDTPDGRGAFYGDHSPPQAAAAGGNYVALACPMGEAGKHLIGCDLNGQRLWGLHNRAAFDGGHISLATDGKVLWVATEGKQSIIYRVDMATGQYKPWQRVEKNNEGKEHQVLDLQATDKPGFTAAKLPTANMRAIALDKDTLAVCLTSEDKIKLLDAETGNLRREISLPAPQSVVFSNDGNLIVLTENRLLRVTPDGKSTPFTAQTFADAYAVARDAAGNIYLSVRGEEHNVKVFSAQGQLIREIGKRGGRPYYGAYDPDGMHNPGQIAVDSQRRLWVPEGTSNPKRTSVWSLDGKLLKDLAGTTTYAGTGAINPYDPTMAFSDNTVYQINLAQGTYRPTYSLARRSEPSDLFPPQADSRCRVVVREGRTYLYTTDSARGSNEVHCTMFDGRQWRSVAHTGVVNRRDMVDQWAKYKHAFFDGHDGQVYAWADKNSDGLVQADELTFASQPTVDGKPAPLRSFYWGQLPDTEGTILYIAGGANALYKFPIKGFTAAGAPLYDVAQPEFVIVDQKVLEKGNGEGMVIGGGDGTVYLNQDPLIAVDKNGRVIGGYPNRFTSVHGSHQAKAARPGYLIGPSSFLGTANLGPEIGEVFDLNGNLGENYLFTGDGLWVQALFKDVRGGFEIPTQAVRGMAMDATTAGGESFGGNFIRAVDGKVYLTIGGTDARVLQVNGLETIRRFNGRLAYTPAQFAIAQRLMQERAANAQAAKVYTIAKAVTPPVIDGKAEDWPELLDDNKSLLEIQESARERYARVQARYDATNLHLGYRVFSPANRMRNAGQDYHLLFKSGDVVDLMLGPETSRTVAGNLRLLMTLMGGQPTAVLNQKVAPGAPANEKYSFSSPWRTFVFDRVVQVSEVKLATGPIANGYFVEAAIPWKVLGVQPKSGLKLKGDVGVLFADAGGTQTVSRQYWSNQATALVNDVPGEADLTPNLWGTLVLE